MQNISTLRHVGRFNSETSAAGHFISKHSIRSRTVTTNKLKLLNNQTTTQNSRDFSIWLLWHSRLCRYLDCRPRCTCRPLSYNTTQDIFHLPFFQCSCAMRTLSSRKVLLHHSTSTTNHNRKMCEKPTFYSKSLKMRLISCADDWAMYCYSEGKRIKGIFLSLLAPDREFC